MTSTDGNAGPINNAPVAADPERTAWFAQFGYTGDDNEMVTLRNDLGTANAGIVWRTLRGLRAYRARVAGPFDRVVNNAHGERRPLDPADHLSSKEYGPLTDPDTGTWLPGVREIIVALTEVDDDTVASYKFTDEPLVPVEGAREA